jgi:hypothetical protein
MNDVLCASRSVLRDLDVSISADFELVRAKVSALEKQKSRVKLVTLDPNFVWGFKRLDSNRLSSNVSNDLSKVYRRNLSRSGRT